MHNNVKDLYESRGLSLKYKTGAKGGEYAGPCPACGGDDRFLVFPEQGDGKGSYYCRACQRGGDAIQFLMDFDGLPFMEASRAINGTESAPVRYTHKTENSKSKNRIEKKEKEVPQGDLASSEKWREKASKFQRYCLENIEQNEKTLAYLAHRGIEKEWAIKYGIGYHSGEKGKNNAIRPRSAWGLAERVATERQKGSKHIWLPRGIVIPHIVSGEVVRLRIRRDDADRKEFNPNMKYYVVPGSSMEPMFLRAWGEVLPQNFVVIVIEGELDALMVHSKVGDFCTVLCTMTAKISSLPPYVYDFLKNAALILVATDVGDASQAGYDGWLKWRDTFKQAKRWACVGGKDPGEMVEADISVRAWVLAGLPPTYAEKINESRPCERQNLKDF